MIEKITPLILCVFLFTQIITSQSSSTPDANFDYDTSDINGTVTVNAPGVLANDTDPDNTTLFITEFIIENSTYIAGETALFAQGEVTLNSDGSYVYTPNAGYTGDVSPINYFISNGTSTDNSYLLFTVEETTNLLEFEVFESCNQGYTVDENYKIIYFASFTNTSNARDYHESSLISNIDITNDLNAIYGNDCISSVEVVSISTDSGTNYVDTPYPEEFTTDAINLNFLDGTSSSIFNTNAINSFTLYPRQTINIQFCITIDAFCNGRPNPTASGSGIDFDSTLNVNSSTNFISTNLTLTDFHSNEAIVTAALYVPDRDPTVNTDGTYDYINTVIITNEGTATANNINYNMGLGRFLDNGISFTQLTVSQVSGPTVSVNTAFNGNTSPQLLVPNTTLAPGETIILDIYALTEPISSTNSYSFTQMSRNQTQGILDGFDETFSNNKRVYSFVTWSDNLGNHLDRYYTANSNSSSISSTSQCSCTTITMIFTFTSSSSIQKIISAINEVPNGILEHQEITFQITATNTSDAVQLESLQIQDDLNTICSGNILSITTPIIKSSTATTNPTLNASYNGTSDINIFTGSSGILEPNESITIEFTVLFNEDCIGNNIASFTALDPLSNTTNISAGTSVSAFTDTDEDGIPNSMDIDDDNDTILDVDEYNGINPLEDHDNDFIPNYRDTDFSTDANTDGIVDIFDFDTDGIPNHFDIDSDNDGIFDLIEVNNAGTSSDSDGIAATDNVGDNGLHNDVEINDTITTAVNYNIPNSDSNGNANFIDIDADDDGIVDNIEAQATFNYVPISGTINTLGIDATAYPEGINPIDSDEDGIPDYIDTNSDNDIRDDSLEGWDTNSDGIAETVASGFDTDNDGLDDAFDTNDTVLNPTNGQFPIDFPDVDNTDNPERDWREIMAIVLLIDSVSTTEGGDLTFTISLVTKNNNAITLQSASDIIVNLSTINGTDNTNQYDVAIAPFDYTQIIDTNVTINANTETTTFTVTSFDDIIYEEDELFTLKGIVTSNNTFTTEMIGIGTIIDNELPPSISMNNSEEEEGISLEHTVTLSHPASSPVIINITTSNNVAVAPNDYTQTTETLIIAGTIDPNNVNITSSFVIPTLIDNTNEPDKETLNVIGKVITSNISTMDLTKTDTILDIDPNPLVFIEDVTVVEGKDLVFSITLLNTDNEPMFNYQPINLILTTSDDTALGAIDYNEFTISSSIPEQTSSTTQTITTIDDNLNEETETLFLLTTINSTDVSNDTFDLINIGSIKDNDIPNLFSPNDDGKSDVFQIAGMSDFPNFKLVIFDRWGSEVYNYNNEGRATPNWWDGSYKGKQAPKGVYFYNLDFNDGKTLPKKNFIELIR